MFGALLGPISRMPTLLYLAGVPGAWKPARRSTRTAAEAEAGSAQARGATITVGRRMPPKATRAERSDASRRRGYQREQVARPAQLDHAPDRCRGPQDEERPVGAYRLASLLQEQLEAGRVDERDLREVEDGGNPIVARGVQLLPQLVRRAQVDLARGPDQARVLDRFHVRGQVEDFARYVLPRVHSGDEGADRAAGHALHHGAELVLRLILEIGAQVAQALMVPCRGHVPLGPGQAVLERGDDDVRARVVRPGLRRSAPEEVFVEPHHPIRQLDHREPRALLVRTEPVSRDFRVHDFCCSLSSRAYRARVRGRATRRAA